MADDLSAIEIAAMCTGKQSFVSQSMADKVAKRRRRSNRDKFERQVAYKCKSCRAWHIGASERRMRK